MNEKIVDFSKCANCTYADTKEDDEPCCACLEIPARLYSHTPMYFERKTTSNTNNNSGGSNEN